MLNTNKEIACKEIIRGGIKEQIRNLGRYLNKLKCNWRSKMKDLTMARWLVRDNLGLMQR